MALFWLIGAPCGWTDNQLQIEFQLKEPKTWKILWLHMAKHSESRWIWFYYQGQDVKNYVPVMRHCMNEAIDSLQFNL